MDSKVDYELLLAKYMEHVGEEEGSIFLGRLQRNGDFYEGRSNKVKFTVAEYEALDLASDLDSAMSAAAPQVVADERAVSAQSAFEKAAGGCIFGDASRLEAAQDWFKQGYRAAAPVQAQEPVAYRVTYKDFRHFSGATATGQDKLQFKPIAADDGYFKGCDSLVVTPLYTAPVQPVAVPDGWQATDDEIAAWADRHDLRINSATDRRAVFEDAESLRPGPAAPAAQGDAKDAELIAELRSVYTIYNGHGEDLRDLAERAANRIAAIAAKAAS